MINYPKSTKKEYELRLGANSDFPLTGGLCLEQESNIKISQSPYNGLINLNCDDGGLLIKRNGQAYVLPSSLGSGAINGVYANYKGNTIFAWGNNLYSQNGSNAPIQIYSGLADAKAFFFVYGNALYMINGTNFIKYDGTTVSTIIPYIPKVSINRKPDGSSSTVNESWNMLGNGFTDQFVGDGTSTVYYLAYKDLDATAVKAVVNGVTINEGSGLTVDRVNGKVTFTTAPVKNDLNPNNVLITAYKTFAGKAATILGCTIAKEFDSRMFLTGNPNTPNFYYVMGISENQDCSYFPEKYEYGISGNDKAVTGFAVHFNQLIVFKEDSTWTVEESTFDNLASFPIKLMNSSIGCDIPGSIQMINNTVTFANTYGGVYALTSTLIVGEKDIKPISVNINGNYNRPGLLQEDTTLLKNAVSVDYDSKYYLCINDHCYVWDYEISFNPSNPEKHTWFYYANVKANCFFILNNTLYYGHRNIGQIVKFIEAKNDFGSAINGLWKSKLMDFDKTDYEKLVSDFWITTRANAISSFQINFYDDENNILGTIAIPGSNTNSFDWNNIDWNNFTWDYQRFAPTIHKKVRAKCRYFQIEIINNGFNENLSIISLVLKYSYTRRVK